MLFSWLVLKIQGKKSKWKKSGWGLKREQNVTCSNAVYDADLYKTELFSTQNQPSCSVSCESFPYHLLSISDNNCVLNFKTMNTLNYLSKYTHVP